MLPRGDLLKLFATIFANTLVRRYGEMPSAAFVAREFNLRSHHLHPISQESARRWIRGLALPDLDRVIALRSWLGINLNHLCPSENNEPIEIHAKHKTELLHEVMKDNALYIQTTAKIKGTLRELAKELSILSNSHLHDDCEPADALWTLPQKILDSLSVQIAILNQSGLIIQVNQAWRIFADSNAAPSNAKTLSERQMPKQRQLNISLFLIASSM